MKSRSQQELAGMNCFLSLKDPTYGFWRFPFLLTIYIFLFHLF